MDARILRMSLLAGALYFGCVALAHALGFKIPGLFIYFSVPSYPYQDQIISFLAFGWASFFYVAAKDPVNNPLPVKAILVSGAVAIGGLSRINAFGDLGGLSPAIDVGHFWAQTLLLLGYLFWLIVFYRRSQACKPA
jgi:hypothetical protein